MSTNEPSARADVDRGDLELVVHAANGLFRMLNWMDSGSIDFSSIDERDLRNVRHELAIAGQLMTDDILRRL